jgi:hypothetical protein
LYSNTTSKNQPSAATMTRQTSRMPANLPSRNCRRETGLDMSVTAVRPSISSLIDMLAAIAPKATAASMMVSKPISLTMMWSSPKVK